MLTHIFDAQSLVLIRMLLAFLTSFALVIASGKSFVLFLRNHQKNGQPIREDGPQSHLLTKKGTPTMGGVLILLGMSASTLLWADISNYFVWLCILVVLVYGLTGFADDYIKVKKSTPNAMTAKMKLALQFATALVVAYFVSQLTSSDIRYQVFLPYIDFSIGLRWVYIVFAMVVISGASNAVNITDGLDGLATGLCTFAFISFAIIAYYTGLNLGYDNIFIPEALEVCIVCAAATGACLAFLWFNCSPAQVFMGDTGSLALGALLGTIAVMTKHEILLSIIGFVFVVETVSVMIQIFWYKRTKKRFFLMAPIHHHFEQMGWKEITVVFRFWIVGILASILGLSSLFF